MLIRLTSFNAHFCTKVQGTCVGVRSVNYSVHAKRFAIHFPITTDDELRRALPSSSLRPSGTGSRVPPLTNAFRIYRSAVVLRYKSNRCVDARKRSRDEISLRVGINLLAEAVRVAAIIRAYTMGNSPAVA